MLLEGKNALITGGSQGIGAAASLELAREGANICLTYRKHEAEAKEYAEEIMAMGRKALAVQCVRRSGPRCGPHRRTLPPTGVSGSTR